MEKDHKVTSGGWKEFDDNYEVGDKLHVKVIGIKEGYLAVVMCNGIKGTIHRAETCWTRIEDINEVLEIDQEIEAVLINKNSKSEMLEFSLKKKEENPLNNKKIFIEGNVVEGIVSAIVDYGVFVDVEGITGIVYVSELSWGNPNIHPSMICKVGESIKVKIININVSKGKLELSLKEVEGNPWKKIGEEYKVGDIVEVEVLRLCQARGLGMLLLDVSSDEIFAKARFEEKLEVNLMLPNLSDEDKEEKVGKKVKAKVIHLDVKREHLNLKYVGQ